jgi:Fe-S-cluster-containing hydrogenase component 2
MEHRDHQRVNWRQIHTYNGFHHPRQPTFHLSLACHHCERPACLNQCPAGAYHKDATSGAVIVHPERCMGCRYCTWACPYDAPKFDTHARVIEKCTFCEDRLQVGLEPACVARCPVEALSLDPDRTRCQEGAVTGFPIASLGPGVRFVPLRLEEPPDTSCVPPADGLARFIGQVIAVPAAKITLKGEWTLVVFTTILPILVAWQGATLAHASTMNPWLAMSLGGGAMALSSVHLGHPERAWRALLNARRSWLSREILLASAFITLLALQTVAWIDVRVLAWMAAVTGFASLFAVDRLYRVALRMGPWNLHSAHTVLNALYLFGWLTSLQAVFLPVGLLKLFLYLHRKHHFQGEVRPHRSGLSVLRVLTGFVLPWIFPPAGAAAMVALGDLVDRCEFYRDLEIPTPQGQMARDMGQRMGLGN